MKKSLILFFGIFAFVSCSDDVSQFSDEAKETQIQNSTFSYDNNLPGGNVYESPYKFLTGNPHPVYFVNSTGDVNLKIYPIFQNGYWDGDGDNDVMDFQWNNGSVPSGISYTGQLGNLFTDPTNEYNMQVTADLVSMDNNSTINFEDLSVSGFTITGLTNSPNSFTFSNNVPNITPLELKWLKDYSKLYGMRYEAFDVATGNFITKGLLLSNFYPGASSNGFFTGAMPSWVSMSEPFTFNEEQAYIPGYLEVMTAHKNGSDVETIQNQFTGNTYKLSFYSSWGGIKIVLE